MVEMGDTDLQADSCLLSYYVVGGGGECCNDFPSELKVSAVTS